MSLQTTLVKEARYSGIGLHSGRQVNMVLSPAPADTGIVFCRTDFPGMPQVSAVAENVTATFRATTIETNGVKIFTIEHLMSAFHAVKLDNCVVKIDAEEPPVADGSALAFLDLLEKTGFKELDKPRREVVIDRIYRIDDEEKKRFVMALPYDRFRVSFTSVNPHPLIGVEHEDFVIDADVYRSEIAPARTIAYAPEVDALHKQGLGLGGDMNSVIVYDDNGWLNPLHFTNELVRHKILDVIGDLRLCGIVRGHIVAVSSGHALNTALAKQIAVGCSR